jgi:hypothetical protein
VALGAVGLPLPQEQARSQKSCELQPQPVSGSFVSVEAKTFEVPSEP